VRMRNLMTSCAIAGVMALGVPAVALAQNRPVQGGDNHTVLVGAGVTFLNVSESTGFGVAVSPVELEPLTWLGEIGGSTGGRLGDIRVLASALSGKKVHPHVRLQIVPVTRGVYLAAMREGLLETIVEAGGIIFPPSAGSNQAVNMGAMSEEEAMISTQARNFPGRNGHPKARHYLASAATVAASAIAGRITDPRSNA